jgi:hypothetical protein
MCPGCGAFIALSRPQLSPAKRTPVAPPTVAPQSQPLTPIQGSSVSILSREPWFYRYLEVAAYVVLGVAFVGFAIALLMAFVAIVSALKTKGLDSGFYAVLGSAFWLLPALAWSLGLIFWSAIVLLWLDVGRKLRTIASRS